MKKHNGNGHSNGHGQSTARNVSSGLQATLAKKIAATLAQTAVGQEAWQRGNGRRAAGTPVGVKSPTTGVMDNQILATYIAIRSGNYGADRDAVAGESGTALGANANANAQSAVALGGNTLAGYNGTAIGTLTRAAGTYSTAVGLQSNASGLEATALGSRAVANGSNSVAIGVNANATGKFSVAVGSQVTVNADNVVALGSHGMTVDSGSAGSFVVAPDKNGGVSGSANAVAILGLATNAASGVAVGNGSKALGASATAMGVSANAAATNALALGNGASALGSDSVGMGRAAQAVGDNTIVIGYNAKSNTGLASNGTGNIAIGSNAVINNVGAGAIAIGRNAKIDADSSVPNTTGVGSVVLGDGATAYGDASTAIGGGSYTGPSNSVALGNGARVLAQGSSVALGVNALADEVGTVSIGNKSTGLRHRIVNMDPGLSTYEAVNIGQLQPLVTAFGGNAAIDPDTGAVTGPTYTLANGGTQTTLGGALKALDDAVSNAGGQNDKYFAVNSTGPAAAASGSDAMALGSGAAAAGNNSVALGANARADAANTVSVGTRGSERKIVNVLAGDVSATSTDAVTGAQLDATNQQIIELSDALSHGGVIDPDTGDTLAVTYNTATKDTITLGNSGRPVKVTNVAVATTPSDAVNLSQLTSTADALRGELTGNLKYVKVNSDGVDANAAAPDSVAIGSATLATIEGSLAVGVRARASAAHAVALGSDSLADTVLTVSLGNKPAGLKRRLVNLQAGVEADDAVSVSQLQPMVTALGGGAAIDPVTGVVTGPTYTLANGGVQTSLEAALGALDQAVSDSGANTPYLAVNSTGADAVANGIDAISLGSGAVATGNNSVALGANTTADVANTVSFGTPGAERKLVNVAAGDLSPTSTEAVTGAQLDSTNQQVGVLENALTGSGLIDPGTGTSLAVTYSSGAKNTIFLGNLNTPVEVMNVGTGLADTDAVNVAQMTGAVAGLRSELSNTLAYVKVRATGGNAQANGTNSVAIGSASSASDTGTVAIGTGARATGANSVALGSNSQASAARTVSVGSPGNERRIVNVDAGDVSADSTDAINGSQLFGALNALATSRAGVLDVDNPIYAIEGVTGDNSASLNGGDPSLSTALAFGVTSSASGTDTVSFGLSAVALSDNAVAIGSNSTIGTDMPYAVTVGSNAQVNGAQAVALGANVQANKDYALAVGTNNTWALGVSSIAIGDGAKERGDSGIAIGKSAAVAANATSCIAVGTGASVATRLNDAIALGTGASVSAGANGGVALGQGAVANRGTAVSLGSATITRQIINLSMGTQGTDAVNVSQLQGVTSALGGGASIGADGSIVPPSYTVDGTAYANVGAAIAAVVSMAGTDPNAVAYDGATKDTVTLGGANGTLLTNLRAGSVVITSTDAINGSQLFGTAQSIATGLGGGAAVNPNGTVTAPLYVIGTTTASNVGSALGNLYDVVKGELADAGLVDPDTGRAIAAVTYDSASQSKVTLGGANASVMVQVSNVAPGAVSDTSTDAVNGSQLNATNQAIGDLTDAFNNSGVFDPGTGESLAVTYANTSKTDIALGTAGTPVTVSNVNAVTLSASSTAAVNGSQLFATNQAIDDLADALDKGGVLDPVTGESLAVTYADASKADITLGAAGTPVTVSNVNAVTLSASSTAAVNGSQLFATNQAITDLADALDNSGVLDPVTGESLAVTYADASKADIALGTAGTPVTVSNVNAAILSASSTAAVNGSQLFATNQAINDLADALDNSGVLDPATGESLAVTYADASKTTITLGTAGTPVAISNVEAGMLSATSTDVVNGAQLYTVAQSIDELKDTLDNSGLLDPATGQSLAVTYDNASKNGVTLGGTGAITPIPLHNIATGTANTDGVNVAQLTSGLNNLKSELTNGAIDLKYIKVNSTGAAAQANGVNAVSIGSGSSATGNAGVAVGTGARAVSVNSVALGYNSLANERDEVVSIGSIGRERRIINVNDGNVSAGSTDAVNGGQLFAVRRALEALAARANGVNDASDPVAAVDGRSGNNVASLDGGDPQDATAAAIGTFSIASGTNALAVGLHNLAGSDYSVALGYQAQTGADHDYSVAMGSDVQTNARSAVAVGTEVRANGEYAVAVGSNRTFAIGNSAVAMGDGVTVHGDNSIAIGRSAMVAKNANDALALGTEASVVAGAIGSVALGHGAVADRGNAISIGGGSVGTRQIIHVSAGTEPTDAVNVAQLQEAMAAMMAEIQSLRSQLAARPTAQ
ncbi:hypothetical protein [Dyella sp.]|uniref:hypothetical protein n=1 Tax=Dyella sp. TaxID=1869338 RepID=UPI002D778C10|nr:hypothetical protein [Dyella sp.]HET7333378.1 hypothetical protein [Dyella sp.]